MFWAELLSGADIKVDVHVMMQALSTCPEHSSEALWTNACNRILRGEFHQDAASNYFGEMCLLHLAVEQCRVIAVGWLTTCCGANPSPRDWAGCAPMHYVASMTTGTIEERLAVCDFLPRKDLRLKCRRGCTPLRTLLERATDERDAAVAEWMVRCEECLVDEDTMAALEASSLPDKTKTVLRPLLQHRLGSCGTAVEDVSFLRC
jgi:hypothetical protein